MIQERAAAIAADWEEHEYYSDAERWISGFWDPGTPFRTMFDKLEVETVAELACGRGRHAAQIVERVGHLYLVDVGRANIDACRRRFEGRSNVEYLVTSGDSLAGIDDGALTAVFSYDAMVHFEADTVVSYLTEISRVLKSGGRALLHYSNLGAFPTLEYGQCPHMRNFFSEAMLAHFAHRRGLRRIESRLIDWGSNPTYYGLDALTLLEKVD
jgi:ubiquinone/menaquinone biosynthesis C-methylase UbiE